MTPPSPEEQIEALEARLREALKFLGHDVREGHSSTLALLELQRIKPDPMSALQLAERIEANARTSLTAIDDFTDLARARTQPLCLEEVDLVDLLVEVVADAWPSATRGGIRIQLAEHPEVVNGWADRQMLALALTKLLRGALAGAARGTGIVCGLQEDAQGWLFGIDMPENSTPTATPGIAPRATNRADWTMPGLEHAQSVAQRHQGTLEAAPVAAGRRVLRLRLPLRSTSSLPPLT